MWLYQGTESGVWTEKRPVIKNYSLHSHSFQNPVANYLWFCQTHFRMSGKLSVVLWNNLGEKKKRGLKKKATGDPTKTANTSGSKQVHAHTAGQRREGSRSHWLHWLSHWLGRSRCCCGITKTAEVGKTTWQTHTYTPSQHTQSHAILPPALIHTATQIKNQFD